MNVMRLAPLAFPWASLSWAALSSASAQDLDRATRALQDTLHNQSSSQAEAERSRRERARQRANAPLTLPPEPSIVPPAPGGPVLTSR